MIGISALLAMLGGAIGAHEIGLLPPLGGCAGAHNGKAGCIQVRHTTPAVHGGMA